MPKYFSYLKVWPTRCLALGQTELMTLAVCVHVYAHVCVCVCEVVSFMFGLVKSMDGPLHSVPGSGFCSTSGPALSTETVLSLIYYKLPLSHTHTHTWTRTHLRLCIHSCTRQSIIARTVVAVGVRKRERVCLLPLECELN